MRRLSRGLSLLVLIMLGASPALALPAPMSDADLLAKSDLVALVRVLSVTCVSVSKDEQTGEALRNYSANVELIEVIKGDVAKGAEVTISDCTPAALPVMVRVPRRVEAEKTAPRRSAS